MNFVISLSRNSKKRNFKISIGTSNTKVHIMHLTYAIYMSITADFVNVVLIFQGLGILYRMKHNQKKPTIAPLLFFHVYNSLLPKTYSGFCVSN